MDRTDPQESDSDSSNSHSNLHSFGFLWNVEVAWRPQSGGIELTETVVRAETKSEARLKARAIMEAHWRDVLWTAAKLVGAPS